MFRSPFRRSLCTSTNFQQMLRRRMREVSLRPSTVSPLLPDVSTHACDLVLQELQTISRTGAPEGEVVPAGLAKPKGLDEFRRKPREGPQRRMVDHRLPAYAECNYRSLHFMMTRFPRVSDFPREKCAPCCLPFGCLPGERQPAALPLTPRFPLARAGSTNPRVSTCCTDITTRTSVSVKCSGRGCRGVGRAAFLSQGGAGPTSVL